MTSSWLGTFTIIEQYPELFCGCMAYNNRSSNTELSRRSMLVTVGAVGSIGVAGCLKPLQEMGVGQGPGQVIVTSSNSTHTLSVEVVSKNETTLYEQEYDLRSRVADETGWYSGDAHAIHVTIDGNRTRTILFETSTSECNNERVYVSADENESVDVETGCVDANSD